MLAMEKRMGKGKKKKKKRKLLFCLPFTRQQAEQGEMGEVMKCTAFSFIISHLATAERGASLGKMPRLKKCSKRCGFRSELGPGGEVCAHACHRRDN